MAEIDEKILTIKSLREQISSLKDELVNIKEGTKEWTETAEKLRESQQKLDNVMKVARGTYVDLNKANKQSVAAMEQRKKALEAEWKQMDKNSKQRKKIAKEIKQLSQDINKEKMAIGNYTSNIGNYTNSISNAFSGLAVSVGGLQGPIEGVNVGLLKLCANPIGAVIAALVVTIGALAKGISSSEENTNRFAQALAPLKSILIIIEKGLQKVASKFLDWMEAVQKNEKVMDALDKIFKGMLTTFNLIEKAFGHLISGARALADGFSAAFNSIKTAIQPVTDRVSTLASGLKDKLQPALDKIGEWAKGLSNTKLGQIFGKLFDTIKEDFTSAASAAESAGDKFEDELNRVNADVKNLEEMRANYATNLRKWQLQQAQNNANIGILGRQIDLAKEEKDYEKAIELTKKRIELEKQNRQLDVLIAQGDYNIKKKENSFDDSNADAKAAESAAQGVLAQAQGKLQEFQYEAEAQIKALENEILRGQKTRIKEEEEFLNVQLETAKKGTKERYELLKESLDKEEELDRLDVDIRIKSAEDKEKALMAIEQKYAIKRLQLNEDFREEVNKQAETEVLNNRDNQEEGTKSWFENNVAYYEQVFKNLFQRFDETDADFKKRVLDARNNWRSAVEAYQGYANDLREETAELYNGINSKVAEEWITRNSNMLKRFASTTADSLATRQYYLDKFLAQNATYEDLIAEDNENLLSSIFGNLFTDLEEAGLDPMADAYIKVLFDNLLTDVQDNGEALKEAIRKEAVEINGIWLTMYDIPQTESERIRRENMAMDKDMIAQHYAALNEEIDLWQEYGDSVTNVLSNIANAYNIITDAMLDNGKITQKEAERRKKIYAGMKIAETTFAVANIVAETAQGVSKTWGTYAQEKLNNAVTAAASGPGAPATLAALNAKSLTSALLNTGMLVSNGTASAAAAISGTLSALHSLNSQGGSAAAASSTAIPVINETNPFDYSRTLLTNKEEQEINKPTKVYILEEDIYKASTKVKTRETDTTW